MRHFMIWPILVPAIAFCHDESASKMNDEALLATSWVTKDHDDLYLLPTPGELAQNEVTTLTVDGTLTEEHGWCDEDIYYDEDNMNDP